MRDRVPDERKIKSEEIEEIVSLDVTEDAQETEDLDAETTLSLMEDALEEEYMDQVTHNTADAEIMADFEERQDMDSGKGQLIERLKEHTSKSPTLSGGDIDAAWDDANVGEETPGGMNPTPDQDMVEEIGEAYGITYEDDEELNTGEKLAERDENRWELDPESAEELDEEDDDI